MIRIETLSDLRRAWTAILSAFSRDLAFADKLSQDPAQALRDKGFDLRGEAILALQRALP